MIVRGSTLAIERLQILLICMALLATALTAAILRAQSQPTRQIPVKDVRAWEASGIDTGWMDVDDDGEIGHFRWNELDPLRDIFALRLYHAPAKVLVEMPAPKVDFSLSMECFLDGNGISDRNLKNLERFTTLKTLVLTYAEITDAGIPALSNLDLHTLDLAYTKVTDIGVERLKPLIHLRVLNIGGTRITRSKFANAFRDERNPRPQAGQYCNNGGGHC
jgi:hypothetical protein